jgi:RNA-directed DNA polymerase
VTGTTDGSQLLEAAASEFNLWVSLYKVVQNKGAPGVDGVSVETVLAHSKELLPQLRRQLLEGSYRPGDIRRVSVLPEQGGAVDGSSLA